MTMRSTMRPYFAGGLATRALRSAIVAAVAFALTLGVARAVDDDDDDAPKPGTTTPTLNREQRDAVGIVVAHAVAAKPAMRIAGFGVVLDPSDPIAEAGDVAAARAAERAASAEVARLEGLYKAGAGASLKNLESAQAEAAKAHATASSASTRFALKWAPLATGGDARRQKILDAAAAGKGALVRVDLPGRNSVGAVPTSATLDIDGIEVKGDVLGALSQSGESQSASVLVAISDPPVGLAVGARFAATLSGGDRAGFLVPRGALIYEEGGAYVYHQLDAKAEGAKPRKDAKDDDDAKPVDAKAAGNANGSGDAKAGDASTQYARKAVKLLMPSGDGWLVDGLDDDDLIVVHGVGVLWSLEGIGAMPDDDDD
jgi:hypothetical protein